MTTTLEAPPAAKTERPPQGRPRRRATAPLIWLVPGLLLLVTARYVPTILGANYAFTDWNGLSSVYNIVGLDNFVAIINGQDSRQALVNTLVLAVTVVIAANVLGLSLALALDSAIKTRNLVRAVFFAPAVLSPLATAYIWRYIFQVDGPLNHLLGAVGLDSWGRSWLADPTWAQWAVAVVVVWQFTGLSMIIYLTGLQSIPAELAEAAAVDGAGPWRRFRRITLPLLAPATTIALTLTTIMALGIFDQVVALTGGGPVGKTATLSTVMYEQTFSLGRFGYGTALALILTLVITLASVTQLLVLRSRERQIR
ncbi:carbohydrate ABC transporter permease [Streptomyces spongiae]|uniref:Sugar ABC transporter permease n=1 Tax=Streptomyces spongiae TaxID=565072 RepID=A0A5N8X835_9ACTN|nr:sugar ABC transporter permease [Streptomyces spongiae]MPY55633.1 sugar ABC transporter permease [Streptomyces spongiae]